MTELDQAIQAAFNSEGKKEDVNQVYLLLLKTNFYLPVKKEQGSDSDEPFSPLFAKMDDNFFIATFDTLEKLQQWAGDQFAEMAYVEIKGQDFITGINEQVYWSVNAGTQYYKEFSPDEVKQLKKIVNKLNGFQQCDTQLLPEKVKLRKDYNYKKSRK